MLKELNGSAKWVAIGITIAGLCAGVGKYMADSSSQIERIDKIEAIRSDVRLERLETSFEYIKKQLDRIDSKLDKQGLK